MTLGSIIKKFPCIYSTTFTQVFGGFAHVFFFFFFFWMYYILSVVYIPGGGLNRMMAYPPPVIWIVSLNGGFWKFLDSSLASFIRFRSHLSRGMDSCKDSRINGFWTKRCTEIRQRGLSDSVTLGSGSQSQFGHIEQFPLHWNAAFCFFLAMGELLHPLRQQVNFGLCMHDVKVCPPSKKHMYGQIRSCVPQANWFVSPERDDFYFEKSIGAIPQNFPEILVTEINPNQIQTGYLLLSLGKKWIQTPPMQT